MDELIKQLLSYAKWAKERPLEIPILLPVYLLQAADELEKAREIVVLWDMYGGSEGITDAFERAEKTRWIPVEERLPEPGKKVLAFWKRGIETYVDFAYRMDGSMGERWRYKNWVAPPDVITHWMHLPEGPEEDEA